MKKPADVDTYIAAHAPWVEQLITLRDVLRSLDLEETIKWGAPVYCLGGKNVVGLAACKSYVGLWFFQGALLDDPYGVLVNAQDGRTRAQRQWRFAAGERIVKKRVREYVAEAVENQRQGREIKPVRDRALAVPQELAVALQGNRKAGRAFAALTPGRQREYADHVASAKREATRLSRVNKVLPLIEAGVGLNDKYRC